MAQEKKKVDGGLAVIEAKAIPTRQTPITPPGSMSAQNMARHCTGCQLCVAQCPNQVLRPATDLTHMMQPSAPAVRRCAPPVPSSPSPPR